MLKHFYPIWKRVDRWLLVVILISTRSTSAILGVILAMMTIGSIHMPADGATFQSGLIILGTAGAVIGIGSAISGTHTALHQRWLGFIIMVHGIVGAAASGANTDKRTSGVLDWLLTSDRVWLWAIIAFFGLRLIVWSSQMEGGPVASAVAAERDLKSEALRDSSEHS
jgi:hypothetical protein